MCFSSERAKKMFEFQRYFMSTLLFSHLFVGGVYGLFFFRRNFVWCHFRQCRTSQLVLIDRSIFLPALFNWKFLEFSIYVFLFLSVLSSIFAVSFLKPSFENEMCVCVWACMVFVLFAIFNSYFQMHSFTFFFMFVVVQKY